MDDSILNTIKQLLGIDATYEHFDPDIIVHVNSALMKLRQLGVGPKEGFSIKDNSSTWNEFLLDSNDFEMVKSYIFLNVKILFDPPTSSNVMDAYNRTIEEYGWRLNMEAEHHELQEK